MAGHLTRHTPAMTVFTPTKTSPISPSPMHASLPASAAETNVHRPRFWAAWTMLTVFIFIGFECILLAAALKGSWFILLAPGVVCCVKAWDSWTVLKKAADER